MADGEPTENRALCRIATLLGVPVTDFFAQAANVSASPEEVAELISAFHAVRNPRMRRACIDVVEAVASDRLPEDAEPGER